MRRLLSIATTLVVIHIFTSCGSPGPLGKNAINLSQDATITTQGKAKPFRAGSKVPIKDQPVFVEAPGYVGVLVIPDQNSSRIVKVNLRPIETWGGEAFNHKLNENLNKLVNGIVNVQALLAAHKAREAMEEIGKLERANPSLSALSFLKASCYVMLNDQARAKNALENALRDFPGDNNGQSLYEELTGHRYFSANGDGRQPASSRKKGGAKK